MRVLLFARKVRDEYLTYVQHVRTLLHESGVELFYTSELAKIYKKTSDLLESKIIDDHSLLQKANIDHIITLGGDGTILAATSLIRDLAIPMLGINLGRLGFLAGVERRQIEDAISHFLKGNKVYILKHVFIVYLS